MPIMLSVRFGYVNMKLLPIIFVAVLAVGTESAASVVDMAPNWAINAFPQELSMHEQNIQQNLLPNSLRNPIGLKKSLRAFFEFIKSALCNIPGTGLIVGLVRTLEPLLLNQITTSSGILQGGLTCLGGGIGGVIDLWQFDDSVSNCVEGVPDRILSVSLAVSEIVCSIRKTTQQVLEAVNAVLEN